MTWNLYIAAILSLAIAIPATAQPPRPPSRTDADPSRTAERWVRQLENDIEHLQEDLIYERGHYPGGLTDQVERVSRAVTHFHHVLRRSDDRRHLIRDFREMDTHVHQLVNQLNQSDDAWLRRQAQRIAYSDDQLHYALRSASSDRRGVDRELLARHAHLLENEANNLEALVNRVHRSDDRMRRVIDDFAEEAEEFHEAVEDGDDFDELYDDFGKLDEKWHRSVEYINQSSYGLYLRRTAQNVDRVHNQIHDMLTEGSHRHDAPGRVERPRSEPTPERLEPRRERSGVEIELPGVGRFRIPF